MATIGEMIGRGNVTRQDGCDTIVGNTAVGVELELENARELAMRIRDNDATYWEVTRDDSLRDSGYEFIFRRPLGGKFIERALTRFKEQYDQCECKPRGSVYCSTHVHMNFLDRTPEDVVKFLAVYLLLEDGLARYCGEARVNNLFCLTASNAEDQLQAMADIHANKSLEFIRMNGERGLKYSALNLVPLTTFGTLESRLGQGMTDPDQIRKWINILLSIKKYSEEQMHSPFDVLEKFSMLGHEGFLKEVFGEYADELREYITQDEMFEGVDRVQYILAI